MSVCSTHLLPLWVCNSSLIFQIVPQAAVTAVATKLYLLSPFIFLRQRSLGAWTERQGAWSWAIGAAELADGVPGMQVGSAQAQCLVLFAPGITFQPHPEIVGFRIGIVYLAEGSAPGVSPQVQQGIWLPCAERQGTSCSWPFCCFMQLSVSTGFKSRCHQGISGSELW